MEKYIPQYKELDGILAVFVEKIQDRGEIIQLRTDSTQLMDFRQRLENAYRALLEENAAHCSVRCIYLLSAKECPSLLEFISAEAINVEVWRVAGETGKEFRKRVYPVFKDYLEKHARSMGGDELEKMYPFQKGTGENKSKPPLADEGQKTDGIQA